MTRWLIAAAALVAVGAAGYMLFLRDEEGAPPARPKPAVAVIGEGEDAVAVAADGTILSRRPPPSEDDLLPQLPAVEPPRGNRVGGTMLEQARVLGAAPPPLRPHIAGSAHGESGVVVELRSGIELRFGDAANAAAKWRAAAAVLADPSITVLDYVDLHAPSRPAIDGSGHTLPPVP